MWENTYYLWTNRLITFNIVEEIATKGLLFHNLYVYLHK